MCSPRSESDANRKPTRSEINNCSAFLRRQIELTRPSVVATLGVVALAAIKVVEYHDFTLKEDAGKVREWNGISLVPLYHPSPQVVASQRGLDRQLEHFQALAGVLGKK
jgi:DNA polymerase